MRTVIVMSLLNFVIQNLNFFHFFEGTDCPGLFAGNQLNMSAVSFVSANSYNDSLDASHGVLNRSGAWCPLKSNVMESLTIHLGNVPVPGGGRVKEWMVYFDYLSVRKVQGFSYDWNLHLLCIFQCILKFVNKVCHGILCTKNLLSQFWQRNVAVQGWVVLFSFYRLVIKLLLVWIKPRAR